MRRPDRIQAQEDDELLRDSVCYWRMSRPQVEARDWDRHAQNEAPESPRTASSSSDEGDDANEYEVLYPSDRGTAKLLSESRFVREHMPSTDRVSESLLQFCGSFPVRMGPLILVSLVRRFTDVRFNWENKTLQSFLEVVCWSSVTLATYTLYHDWLVALQVGTFVGALMSICDEVVLQFVRGLARVIRNQHGGSELLERLGFDIPKNGKAPTNGHEIDLIKTIVFGYLGVVAIRSIWEHYHDVKLFALLTAAVGVAFVVTAEFFCLWLPTRRIGLTLQSRFTNIRANWEEHPMRSLVELLTWTVATTLFFYTSNDFLFSFQLGTLVAVLVCLLSGLDELPDVVSSDETASINGEYWHEQLHGEIFTSLAAAAVKVQDAFNHAGDAIQTEAMKMYEGWSQ